MRAGLIRFCSILLLRGSGLHLSLRGLRSELELEVHGITKVWSDAFLLTLSWIAMDKRLVSLYPP